MLDAEQFVNIEFSARNGTPDLIHHRLVRSPFIPFVNRFGQDDSKLGKGPLLGELMCRLRVDEDSVHVKDDRCDLRLCFQMGVDPRQCVCSSPTLGCLLYAAFRFGSASSSLAQIHFGIRGEFPPGYLTFVLPRCRAALRRGHLDSFAPHWSACSAIGPKPKADLSNS